ELERDLDGLVEVPVGERLHQLERLSGFVQLGLVVLLGGVGVLLTGHVRSSRAPSSCPLIAGRGRAGGEKTTSRRRRCPSPGRCPPLGASRLPCRSRSRRASSPRRSRGSGPGS